MDFCCTKIFSNFQMDNINKYHAAVLVLILLLFSGCVKDEKNRKKVILKVGRFEKEIYETSPEYILDSLPALKLKYAPFFQSTNDEFWRNIRIDSVHVKLYTFVKDSFENFSEEIDRITSVLEHYTYYFEPPFRKFYLYTYVSGLDYDYPVIFSDSLLFVGLDLYLGENFPAYSYLPRYLARERNRKYIPIDVASAISASLMEEEKQTSETLLAYMIREGIKLYVMRKLVPDEEESSIFKYTKEQLNFCKENERNIWLYFINNKLLFDTNIMTKKKFIDPAPFTKMGTDFDNQIPGRIGRWVGYRIVNEYMRKNKQITLKELVKTTDYQSLFYKANYKP